MPRVTFKPLNKTVDIEPGTSVLDAAREAGVRIRNDCSGKGVCGRCVVDIESGIVHGLGSRYKLDDDQRLACRTLVLETDVTVFVPESSREVSDDVTVSGKLRDSAGFSAETAIIKRKQLKLDPPSLDDNLCDFERLCRALYKWREGSYTASPDLLKNLPEKIRDFDWNPEVTLAEAECGLEVLQVDRSGQAQPVILAVDIGTTALKAALILPGTLWTASCYNSQVVFGPDVISRIIYCQNNKFGLPRLQGAVIGDINRLLATLIGEAKIDRSRVWGCVVAGNTTMMHILAGILPLWIRREPYTGGCYHLPPFCAAELGIDINKKGKVFFLPSVSGFVGADISSGVLETGIYSSERVSMLIDLGTNGEIVLGSKDFLLCCSASAGPAFEGEASDSGTRAMPGAIESVWWDGGLRWSTIKDEPPVGICGSGYIDLLAVLLQNGIINKGGQFDKTSPHLCSYKYDGCEYVVAVAQNRGTGNEIVINQADIDNLLRSKAAIYAAAEVLLDSIGMEWSDLERIMLAGSFGEKINKENAVRIGLMPDIDREKIKFMGNTALKGTIKVAKDEKEYHLIRKLARNMTYVELSTHPTYMQQFMAAKFLPHTKTDRFPTVSGAGGLR